MSSKYYSIWLRLKQSPNVPIKIAAHKALHRRIYKAIIKRKYEDSLWHLEMLESELQGTLSKSVVGDTLIVTLTISPYISLERMF